MKANVSSYLSRNLLYLAKPESDKSQTINVRAAYFMQRYIKVGQRKGREFKNCFPHISVYMHFVSPHWICTAGDFQTQTEAYEFIKEIRGTGLVQTSEMIVVKSRIKIYNT